MAPPITPCFGIGCAKHKDCRAYHELEAPGPQGIRLGFCAGAHEGKPVRFVPMHLVIKDSRPQVERRVA